MLKTRNEINERRREGQSLSSILPKLRKMVFTIRTLTAEDFLSEKGQARPVDIMYIHKTLSC